MILVERSDNLRDLVAQPLPVVVDDDVSRVGNKRTVVSVELARLVRSTVVAGVAHRRLGASEQALSTMFNLNGARHFVDHSVAG